MAFRVLARPRYALLGRLLRPNRPQLLRVQDNAIELVAGDEICGHVPFVNVARIRNLWNKDDRPYWDATIAVTQLAAVLTTLAFSVVDTLWYWMFADSMGERSRGIVIALKNAEEPGTRWPAAGFIKEKKQIRIEGRWEMPFAKIVERLREEELVYLQGGANPSR